MRALPGRALWLILFLVMQSEFAFIDRIRARAQARPSAAPDLVCGIGDDAAVLSEREGHEMLVTADLLIEDVDFKRSYTPPRCLGHKALAVSLSDIAAMGGRPRHTLLTLGIPRSYGDEFWEEFFAGYFALAERFGVTLIGGDTSSAPEHLTLDSIVIGECQQGKAVRRSGAQVGDAIYLTGEVGGSAAGLELLRRGERLSEGMSGPVQEALRRHLVPEPRVEFGRQVGERGLAHAMIDVSDGVSQDLAHICEESAVGAMIDFDSLPVAAEVRLVAENEDAAFALAVRGGEDYELLLTASRDAEAALIELSNLCQLRLTRVGEVVASAEPSPKLWLRRGGRVEPLAARGFDHFA